MPDTRFWITARNGQPIDAKRYDPQYSWDRPTTENLEPGDSITVYDRTPMLTQYERDAIESDEKKARIKALRAELDQLDPPAVVADGET